MRFAVKQTFRLEMKNGCVRSPSCQSHTGDAVVWRFNMRMKRMVIVKHIATYLIRELSKDFGTVLTSYSVKSITLVYTNI